MHSENYVPREAKTTNNLGRREYQIILSKSLLIQVFAPPMQAIKKRN